MGCSPIPSPALMSGLWDTAEARYREERKGGRQRGRGKEKEERERKGGEGEGEGDKDTCNLL